MDESGNNNKNNNNTAKSLEEAMSSFSMTHYDPKNPNDVEDFTPTPREGFHSDPELCRWILSSAAVAAAAKLEIKSSGVGSGSGLFVAAASGGGGGGGIEPGREIYRSKPVMWALDHHGGYGGRGPGDEGLCEECGRDGDGDGDGEQQVKACGGCLVVKFCGKKCQKSAWNKFHKDECKTLRNVPQMMAQHLLAHRLMFWQQKGYITTKQGKAIERMETHFNEYSKGEESATKIFDVAMAVRKETGNKVGLGLVWRMVPCLLTNCVRLRPAFTASAVGCALDLPTAVINHSCDPNAFVFFENGELRLRSLKKIAPGEEITICYVDPTMALSLRQEALLRDHFFECGCPRCKSEHKEERVCVKKGESTFETLHKSQKEIVKLIANALKADKFRGIYKQYEDLENVETKLRTILCSTFKNAIWPDSLEPLPSARLSLALLHLNQGKPDPALRNGLKGILMNRLRNGPEWVNVMMDMVKVLIAAGSLTPDKIEDNTFPSPIDIQAVAYGYAYETCKEAGKAYGGDSEYTKAICEIFAKMTAQKVTGQRPGTAEFEKEFEEAQMKLMAWAGVAEGWGVVLSS